MASLLMVASLLPLALTALGDIRETRERLLSATAVLLAARGDQLVGELDGFNRVYARAVDKITLAPVLGPDRKVINPQQERASVRFCKR